MKILIVGGAGYVGGALTDILADSKHDVRVYDSLVYEESYRKNVDFVFGDVRDHKVLLPQLQWADVVVWLAALVGDGACALNPEISHDINDASVKWVADHFDGRIIFTSTCSVYGAHDTLLDENSVVNPLSVYAATKLAAEKHLLHKNALIFRLGTLYGLSDTYSRVRMDLVVNTLTGKAFSQGKLTVFSGQQFRPILHVRDVAQAIADNLDTKHTGIFNLRSENVKILDLAERVAACFDNVLIEKVDMKFEDARNYHVTAKKAEDILGFSPEFKAEDGIKEIKRLLEEHRISDIDSPRYTNQLYLSMFGVK